MKIGRMSNTFDVVREFFPDASDDDCGYLLWNHTGYPSFWGQGGRKTVAGSIRYSLRRMKQALDNGKVLCFYCDRPYKGERVDGTCPACTKKYS
jgi:hypothetical protein